MKELEENTEEVREYGKVHWQVYLEYFRAGGPNWLIALMLFMFVAAQAAANSTEWWLSKWYSLTLDMKTDFKLPCFEANNNAKVAYI